MTSLVGPVDPSIRAYLIAELTGMRADRMNRPVPPVGGDLRVYDNGGAQIFRTRALPGLNAR